MTANIGEDIASGLTVLLLARSALSAVPRQEMERTREQVASLPGVNRATFGFSEHGLPTLRDVFEEITANPDNRVLIIPFLMPAEPHFNAWLTRTLQRWQAADTRPWPEIRVAPLVADHPAMADVLASIVRSGGELVPMPAKGTIEAQASIVPAQKRCVLVCFGGPCNVAGAAIVWGHLRNEQDRLSLRTIGDGTFAAKSSCLGPCALAPVVQVWPEGTYYGGVSESGIDRIIQSHLLDSKIVEDLAYRPTGRKQSLRASTTI